MAETLPLAIVLDNIRSAYNVGSILRTAECAGISAVYTCGYTPPASHPKVRKTALDAEKFVTSAHYPDLAAAIVALQADGYQVYALEKSADSHSLWEQDLPLQPTALIVGNEVAGVQLEVLQQYNVTQLEIPMYGQKESLNVANAGAIAIYDILKRWRKLVEL